MNIPVDRFRWLAPLLVIMALALAPQIAGAHGGHVDEAGVSAPPAGSPAAPVPAVAAPQAQSAALSPSCPAGHGGTCCCHAPAACIGGGQIPVVSFGGWARLVPPLAEQVEPSPVESLPPSQFVLSPALPRAPPRLS